MANAKETRSVKNNIGLALFILILVAMFFIPTSETLTAAGRNSLGLLLATIVCMLTGGLPIGVLCMLVIPLMYICGCVETPAAALAGFQNQSAFFMLASFGLTCAVTRVPLSRRLMRGIITKAGRNVNTVLLAIMLCCGLLSSIVSNIAACSAFIPLVLDFLSIYENEDERKRTGREQRDADARPDRRLCARSVHIRRVEVHETLEGHVQISAGLVELFALPGLCLPFGLEAPLLGLLALAVPVSIAVDRPPGVCLFFLIDCHD